MVVDRGVGLPGGGTCTTGRHFYKRSRLPEQYNFQVSAAGLSDDDPRLQWDASIGGDIDLLDYGSGRINLLAEYHSVLGNELQPFDPNQSYYTFDVSASYRIKRSELSGYLHHVSRHVGDRPKEFGVAWNSLGTRVTRPMTRNRLDLSACGYIDYVYDRAFVDYRSMMGAEVASQYPNDRRVSVVAGGRADLVITDQDIAARSRVSGGLAHVGVRFEGSAAALEFFVALEQRIDPHPLTRGTEQWALAGFRLLSR